MDIEFVSRCLGAGVAVGSIGGMVNLALIGFIRFWESIGKE